MAWGNTPALALSTSTALGAVHFVVTNRQTPHCTRRMGIVETLRRALSKLVMRAAIDQEKTACRNLQLCSGLKAGMEGTTNDVGHRWLERVRRQRSKEDEAGESEEEEEERGEVAGLLNILTIETVGTEEEMAEGLAASLDMEMEEDTKSEGEEESWGTQKSTGSP